MFFWGNCRTLHSTAIIAHPSPHPERSEREKMQKKQLSCLEKSGFSKKSRLGWTGIKLPPPIWGFGVTHTLPLPPANKSHTHTPSTHTHLACCYRLVWTVQWIDNSRPGLYCTSCAAAYTLTAGFEQTSTVRFCFPHPLIFVSGKLSFAGEAFSAAGRSTGNLVRTLESCTRRYAPVLPGGPAVEIEVGTNEAQKYPGTHPCILLHKVLPVARVVHRYGTVSSAPHLMNNCRETKYPFESESWWPFAIGPWRWESSF